MKTEVSKKSIHFKAIIGALLAIVISFLGYYDFYQYFLCFLPLLLVIIAYKWSDSLKYHFGQSPFVFAFLVITVVIAICSFVVAPCVDILRNDLYISINNFNVFFQTAASNGSLLNNTLILYISFVISLVLLFIFVKVFYRYKGYIGSGSFNNGVDEIIELFNNEKANSEKTAISLEKKFDKASFSFLLNKGIINKTKDKKYFLTMPKDIKLDELILKRMNIKKITSVILIVICIVGLVFYGTSKKSKTYETIIADDFTISFPKDYFITSTDVADNYKLSPKNDISGQNGVLYLDVTFMDSVIFDDNQRIEYCKLAYGKASGSIDYSCTSFTNEYGYFVVQNDITFVQSFSTIYCVFVTDKDNYSTKLVTIECRRPKQDSKMLDSALEMINSIRYVEPNSQIGINPDTQLNETNKETPEE